MEGAVLACIRSPCVDRGQGIVRGTESVVLTTPGPEGGAAGVSTGAPPRPTPRPAPESAGGVEIEATPVAEVLDLPLIGTISLGTRSLGFSTAVIAFVDGFNPCSLWVLSILLGLVLHTGSRRKTMLVGGIFLLVTSAVYGLFIVGLFKLFTVIDFIGPIQAIVALFALGFALVNIKDYFWYGRGFSFSIPERHKPRIYSDIRSLLTPGQSTAALLGATVVMAFGIALIELPCTAGFPVLWSNLVASHAVGALEFSLLLALYLTIYLLAELVGFGAAVATLKVSRMQEKHGRALKLLGGTVMLALALVLLLDPDRMNTLGGALPVVAAALAATLLILLLHRPLPPAPGEPVRTLPQRHAGVARPEAPPIAPARNAERRQRPRTRAPHRCPERRAVRPIRRSRGDEQSARFSRLPSREAPSGAGHGCRPRSRTRCA
jgi:cytochrome c biogenesis protein CcdA